MYSKEGLGKQILHSPHASYRMKQRSKAQKFTKAVNNFFLLQGRFLFGSLIGVIKVHHKKTKFAYYCIICQRCFS